MGRWLSKLTVKPGIQEPFLGIIQKRLAGGDDRDKMTNLCFDEMHIRKTYEYDHRNKQVYGNHKKMMVVMVRSLFSDWKEVVYFNFDTNMTKNLIEEIIVESRGKLVCPTLSLWDTVTKYSRLFDEFHGKTIYMGPLPINGQWNPCIFDCSRVRTGGAD